MADCPCPRCNGRDEMSRFFGGYEVVSIDEEPTRSFSSYDQINDFIEKYKSKLTGSMIEELEEIQEQIGDIDDEVTALQRVAHNDDFKIKLGEISKKLY
jgi:FMN-dependent NADH-azoreductase